MTPTIPIGQASTAQLAGLERAVGRLQEGQEQQKEELTRMITTLQSIHIDLQSVKMDLATTKAALSAERKTVLTVAGFCATVGGALGWLANMVIKSVQG